MQTDPIKIHAALSAPFEPHTVKWRVSHGFERNGQIKCLMLAYIDARHVFDRLDDVMGIGNWQTTIEETAKGRVLCSLGLRIEGDWIVKTDGAGATAVEAEKGAISDSIKRAAVQFGIARYLYGMGNTYAHGKKTPKGSYVLADGEHYRLVMAITRAFRGEEAEARKILAQVDDSVADTPPAQSTKTSPASTETPPATVSGTGTPPPQDKEPGVLANDLLEKWDELLNKAWTLADLKIIHAEMNKTRTMFQPLGNSFVEEFKKRTARLSSIKAVIEANSKEMTTA